MKIAYLLGSLNRGGTETLLLDVFRNAKANKLNAIGIYRKTGALEVDFVQSGVTLFKLSVQKNVFGYLLHLRKLLIKNQIEIVHAQQPIDALNALLATIGTGIKIILTLHGFDYFDTKLGNMILRFIIRKTDINIYVSDTQRQYYQKKYRLKPKKQQVVYNGISFDKLETTHSLTPSEAMSNVRDELQLSSDTLLFGTVGNFVHGRDQLTICRFLKLLNEQNVDFHFVFVGKRIEDSAFLYDKCVDYCNNNGLSKLVSFLGSRNDVPKILNELDAFIYSTNHDTFGIAVVEAMTVNIPVFVNDWKVMSEITCNGKFATFYKTKDENDLLRKFMLFLQNKQVYQTKAIEAAKFVRKRYSIEKHIDALKAIYNQIVING